MHSIASVGSAGGAAQYFAKDDYYLGEGPGELSEWGGKGAAELGLDGEVKRADFENLLNSILPDGTLVNGAENKSHGLDLTFSLPKSASVLALVAGDTRIHEAHRAAVKATMVWAEQKFAEARDYSRVRKGEPIKTGNLVYALFEHDTSRKLDPQSHIHVVVAAITQTAQGQWKALWNGELWRNNSVIGSAYHAFSRAEMEKLGYETRLTGKHGQYEISGVSKEVIQEFSQRREEIVQKSAELGISTPQGQDRVVVNTRDAKLNVDDKEALRADWQRRATQLGFDGKPLIEAAIARSVTYYEQTLGSPERVQSILGVLRDTLGQYFRASDPLATNGMKRIGLTPSELRTEIAVASAVRIHGQREAAFPINQIAKTALDLGLKDVTADKVDARISRLIRNDLLVPGVTDRIDGLVSHVTTHAHIAQERQLLDEIDKGRGAQLPVLDPAMVTQRIEDAAAERPLNGEQLGAATLALTTRDRIAVIQGVAGAGKTTLIAAMSKVARDEGKEVLGLAFANKMVGMLRDEAKIEAQTVSSFVNAHISGARAGAGARFEASREALKDKILVLDEASLVANEPMNNLAAIANSLGVQLVAIGDRQQLQPIDAGKAFSLMQSHDPAIAHMDTSQRQRTDHMKQVAALTREGKFREAFEVLGQRVVQAGKGVDHIGLAAQKWLGLEPQDRDRTALYASGRKARSELNTIVQDGLKSQGILRGDARVVTSLLQVNATREELRYAHIYEKGQVLDVVRNSLPGGLERGRYDVMGRDRQGNIRLRDEKGRTLTFNPEKIDPKDKSDALKLSQKEKVRLHEGDKIRWSDTDKDRNLVNSEQARVLSLSADTIRIENARGEIHDLKPGDKMLERLGLSYAINMHQAQGMTTDKGIGVMHSAERNLSNQRLTHVMATRVREDIEIVTNDRDQLVRAIERNPGDKSSALETIGEKTLDRQPDRLIAREFSPRLPGELKMGPDKLPPMPGVSRESMRSVPELNLPERNIERSR